MYRKERGVHFNPYYDKGDYQIEVNVLDLGYIGDSRVAHDFMGSTYAPEQQAILNMARVGEYTRDNMSEVEFNLKVTEDARQIEDQRKDKHYCNSEERRKEHYDKVMAKLKADRLKKKYHKPRLYYSEDLPFIHSTFDWVKGKLVCMDLAFLQGYKRYIISRIAEVI